jgi:hypothetical protein
MLNDLKQFILISRFENSNTLCYDMKRDSFQLLIQHSFEKRVQRIEVNIIMNVCIIYVMIIR